MKFKELQEFYNKNFSLGYLNTDIKNRFALISFIGYLYQQLKPKKPDLTYYSLIYKLNEGIGLSDDFIKGLAIVCEDFSYGCKDFITFGKDIKEMPGLVKGILKTYIPF